MSQGQDWWRRAAVYQIYPRSFADGNADGIGDIPGMIAHLDHLAALSIDAVWISPWYPSPMADGGYDVSDYFNVDPMFGTLDDADAFIAGAHQRGIRVLVDLVPNHCSNEHALFKAALAAAPGSAERAMFHFRDGRGEHGQLPPNNWPSLFGGSAWERVVGPDGPEQWYLHMFAAEQPDFNWENPAVGDFFDEVLRFWFDRGVDGLRVDVADAMAKHPDLPDTPHDETTGFGNWKRFEGSPFWDRPEVLQIHARWRRVAAEYADTPAGERIFIAEANADPLDKLVRYVGPGQLHSTFNFDHLWCAWDAPSLRAMIDRSLAAHRAVGAPATWVLGNHDQTRVATRYGKPITGRRFTSTGVDPRDQYVFAEHLFPLPVDIELGRRRARAAALLEFALPGGCYVYQGEELGLEEVEDLPAEARQDPSFFRTGGQTPGRDGCRVPLPWSGDRPPYGFGDDGSWLPQPAGWAALTAAAQSSDPDSTLALYRTALGIRRTHPALGDGTLTWLDAPAQVLHFTRKPEFGCLVNLSGEVVALPEGVAILVASAPVIDGRVEPETAVWYAPAG